jgi:response regulator of citrate/malate metabolism
VDRQAFKSILLVEDDPSVAFVVSELVAMFFSAAILTARSCVEAERLWNEDRSIVAVLADVNLPDGRGVDLARAFAADRMDVEIVLMSGDLLSRALLTKQVGKPVKLLLKPFSASEINSALSGLLPENSRCADRQPTV